MVTAFVSHDAVHSLETSSRSTRNAMAGTCFRAVDINSAGQALAPASPELSTLMLSTRSVFQLLPLRQALRQDVEMYDHDKENAAAHAVRSDTPISLEGEDMDQPRHSAKTSTQSSSQQSSPVKIFPLGPTARSSKSFTKNSQGTHAKGSVGLPDHPDRKQRSRPASPIKTPRDRPPSRPSSPLKRSQAPGKNERFETTPTGFRYTIELPESKIVRKKDGNAPASLSKPSTPVKSFSLLGKRNSPKRGSSPAKAATPRKAPLKAPAATSEKKTMDTGTGVNGAEPTPKAEALRGHRKRDSVKLTKANGVHAGTPTVEVTKEDVWTGVQLQAPLTPKSSSAELQVKEEGNEGEAGPGTHGVSPSPMPMASQDEEARIKEKTDAAPKESKKDQEGSVLDIKKAAVASRRQYTPMNFGEMLRNSSQDALQTRKSFDGESAEEQYSSSPTILDKVRRNSGIVTESLLHVIAKPHFNGKPPVPEEPAQPVVKDFANKTEGPAAKEGPQKSGTEERKSSHKASPLDAPRTPSGTPPALIAAMEADMKDIRSILRRSMGDKYVDTPQSPELTHWLGSSTNGRSPPNLPTTTSETPSTVITPRRNLQERMTAAKQSIQSKDLSRSKKTTPPPLTLRTKDLGEPRTPFHSRLPRISPTKPSPMKPILQVRTPGTIPQAPRTSPFAVEHAAPLILSRVPAMASHRARFTRASETKGETIGFASAEDIAKQVEAWNMQPEEEKKKPARAAPPAKAAAADTPSKPMSTPRPKGAFMRPTATSASKEKQSYTPPGSPATQKKDDHTRSPFKTHVLTINTCTGTTKPPPSSSQSPIKNPKLRALTTSRTPLPRTTNNKGVGKVNERDVVALRTPSREMSGKLDRSIDEHLEREARGGRVFTPGGQRISELLARRGIGEAEGAAA